MPARSIDLRLQRLERRHQPGHRVIVIKATGEGDEAGAKAYFHQQTGESIGDDDMLVLMQVIGEPHPSETFDCRAPEPASYEILSVGPN